MKDYEAKTQHVFPCNMMVYTTVQNKTPSLLLNVIVDSDRTDKQ